MQKELEQCTFQPNIDKGRKYNYSTKRSETASRTNRNANSSNLNNQINNRIAGFEKAI